ncbi:MAG: PQQ-binding-like beta-propeller repeat protein [Planctomycetota bacterium]|nr:PQQ-binding-like beta-propeller repeat protein [Planctomycetota bacterium]MDA0917664.1 PQQ-binding-like beta-propeller repeat protein [Planctomycetota bacterium]MDA1159139.1 PQQ-binding-like beta-propeller repeat protein [Planctomycetota bacterium]
MPTRCLPVVVASLFCLLASSVFAENWPGWRGPRGDGTSLEKNVPISWDGAEGRNVAWKVAIPGEGHASPTVWGDRIFVVSCLPETKSRVLISLDRRTGKQLWQKTVVESPLESKHSLNSFASSTPTTDGKLVYVAFLKVDGHTVPAPNVGKPRPITPGEMVVAAYDFEGNQQWMTKPGEFISAHGFCSCPVIFEDLLIVNGDHDGDSYVVALNRATGDTVWKTPRRHKTRSYVTPIIREINGRQQMVFSGSKCIVSLDPRTGKMLWNVEGPTEQYVASMVYDNEKFYMAAGFPTHHVMAVRPDGQGDVTDSHVSWHTQEVKCYVPSPVLVDKYLIVADDRGTANCFETTKGERLWQGRMGSHFSASLVTAGGLVYFQADDGTTRVVKPGPDMEIVSENELGERSYASPAISEGQLFIRGEKHLFCIGATQTASR